MTGVWATLLRELRAYFFSPLAYVILVFFLLSNGRDFSLIVTYLSDPRAGGSTEPLFQLFLGGTILFWFLALFVPPILTMRLIAEERRSGTIESLMTAPVSAGQVVLGKYLAALAFYVFLWLPTVLYVLIIGRSATVDWGPILSAYLGIFGLGAFFLAIGVFCSAFAKNQVVAAVATIAALVFLIATGFVESLASGEMMRNVLSYVNLLAHMEEFAKGVVDTRRLLYYGSSIVLLLFLASRTLDAKKWR